MSGESMVHGLSTANLGKPDIDTAAAQQAGYIAVLECLQIEVLVLDAAEQFPDSVFVEDTAILTPDCAIITRPGADSRRGETELIEPTLSWFFPVIERIEAPGLLDGGDVMAAGDDYYIGLSHRTNEEGARQLTTILAKYGKNGIALKQPAGLHLKSNVSYIENGFLVAAGEEQNRPEFDKFKIIPVDPDETYAANCVWINGTVILPLGFPKTKATIEACGYKTIALDMSEFQKLDGGLSCLSLRF